jgi:hypothetical protein
VSLWAALAALGALAAPGYAAIPDRRVEPQCHNALAQLHRMAMLPLVNQSAEPTVAGEAGGIHYYCELQAIHHFELMPVGVAKQLVIAAGIQPWTGADLRSLARDAGSASAGRKWTGNASTRGAAGDHSPFLVSHWPEERGFVPPPPSPNRRTQRPQHEPIITHTRIHHGQDAQLTDLLEDYYFCRDDARCGGWLGYLQRPDDYVRFCCHVHATETLAARGGAWPGRVVYRWPIGRYDP